ncbi:MAG: hypothetical protein NVS3B20_08960 [Polyangiales bacterium]
MVTSVMRATKWTTRLTCASAALCASLVTATASANPRPLPFSYPYETLPQGSAELEQYLDLTPIKKYNDDKSKRLFDTTYRLQTEFEYGITDRLELGLYLVFQQYAPAQGDPSLKFDGTKQRLRYRIADEGTLPIDLAVYFEVTELHDEFELEEKLIAQKRFGNLKAIANLWVEQEWERGKRVAPLFNPTLGLAYQIDPKLSIGLEYWARGSFTGLEEGVDPDSVEAFNHSTHHYAGPALMFNFGRLWWSTAAYLRLDRMSRNGEVGDQFGKVWVRSVVGIEL